MPEFTPNDPPVTLQDLQALNRGWSAQGARHFVIGCGLMFLYPAFLLCVALAQGRSLRNAFDAFQQVLISCGVFYWMFSRDKEHPLGPALKRGYVNPAIPPEEADFSCRLRRSQAVVAALAYLECTGLGQWAASVYSGSPLQNENKRFALWAALACVLGFIYLRRTTAHIRADWAQYVAARDGKSVAA